MCLLVSRYVSAPKWCAYRSNRGVEPLVLPLERVKLVASCSFVMFTHVHVTCSHTQCVATLAEMGAV